MFRTALLSAVLFSFAFVPVALAATEPSLTVQIDGTRVTASGVTPRGDVVFFARSAGWFAGMRHLQRFATVVNDDDRDGVVTLTVEGGVPPSSTWVIVDFETGATAIAAPSAFTPRRIDLPNVVWRAGVSYVDLSREWLDVLLVRPRVGAWSAQVWQGGARDTDSRNDANLRAGMAAMKPLLGSNPAPPTATPRDVLVIIDPRALDVFARQAE